jgi:hypothetical protein
MATLRRLISTPSFGDVLSIIASLSDDAFQRFSSEIGGENAFDLDLDRCERISRDLGTDTDTVAQVIHLCGYLYGQIHSRSVMREEIPTILGEFLDEYSEIEDNELRRNLIERMSKLLARRESADAFRKAQRLRVGFLKNALSFASFVDLRPDFNEEKNSVQRLIPVAQFRITTDSNVPEYKDIVIQLDERSVRRLKDAVVEVERKFATLGSGPFSEWLMKR